VSPRTNAWRGNLILIGTATKEREEDSRCLEDAARGEPFAADDARADFFQRSVDRAVGLLRQVGAGDPQGLLAGGARLPIAMRKLP